MACSLLLHMLPPTSFSTSFPQQSGINPRTPYGDCRALIRASVPWFLRHSDSRKIIFASSPRRRVRESIWHQEALNPNNHMQNSLSILVQCFNDRSKTKKKMAFLAPALNGFLLSCLLMWSITDSATARAAVFGLEFFSDLTQVQPQQMEPSRGNCATCLGVVDETLGACGAAPNCVSTFDDRPSFFIAPWEFPGNLTTAFEQMNLVLSKAGGNIVEQGNRYIHAVFIDKDDTIDDLEFLFSIPSEDATVNIRSASRKVTQNDYGRNQKRLERIRKALTWEEVPVLRNRSRKLFFLESPWDTFGPEPPPAFNYKDKVEFVPD